MNLLLSVHMDSDGSSYSPCARWQPTSEMIQDLIAKIEMVRDLKAKNSRLYQMEFWDSPLDWFDRDKLNADLDADQEIWDAVDFGEFIQAPVELAARIEKRLDSEDPAGIRTECDRISVMEDSVLWKCYIKHTGIELETCALHIKELRHLLTQLE